MLVALPWALPKYYQNITRRYHARYQLIVSTLPIIENTLPTGRQMCRERIFKACQEILEEGHSVTVKAVVDKIGGSSRDIAPVVKEFKESQKKEALITVSNGANVGVNSGDSQDSHVNIEQLADNPDRVDRDAQLNAARKVISTAFYEKTLAFTLPGLKEEVHQRLSEIDALATAADQTLSPKGMLEWLKAKQH